MSKETLEWLNNNVLVGFTEQRGHAWHYRQGADNHYPNAVPVGDVQKRLFNWQPVTLDRKCLCGCGNTSRDVLRSDNRHRMGVFTDGYEPHDYNEWLVKTVSTILGDTLQVGSAGLLRAGAVAWVSVEVPETLTTKVGGVQFRPHLLATTSFDGSIATTYKRVVTIVVCDNTLEAARGEKGQQYKTRHTSGSKVKLADARAALQMVHGIADDFDESVRQLLDIKVTNADWRRFLDAHVEIADDASKAAITRAENKRGDLTRLYMHDDRVAPWTGTAFGVLQAVDTHRQHVATVQRGSERAERNMLSVVTEKSTKENAMAMQTLSQVLGKPLTIKRELVSA